MKFDIYTCCVTRGELARLSEFQLSAVAVKSLPKKDREFARTIPALTIEVIRTCERYGLFDDFRFKQTRIRGNWFLWKRRKRGETRLYTVLDVAVARLVAWGRATGLTIREMALLIRGQSDVRALIAADGAESVYAYRIGRTFAGCVVPVGEKVKRIDDPQIGEDWIFPIAWLGLTGSVLPRVRKMREVHPAVWRHSWVTPDHVIATEAKRSERVQSVQS
jgi:hypothetical protein